MLKVEETGKTFTKEMLCLANRGGMMKKTSFALVDKSWIDEDGHEVTVKYGNEETKKAEVMKKRKLSELDSDMVHDLNFATLIKKIVKSINVVELPMLPDCPYPFQIKNQNQNQKSIFLI